MGIVISSYYLFVGDNSLDSVFGGDELQIAVDDKKSSMPVLPSAQEVEESVVGTADSDITADVNEYVSLDSRSIIDSTIELPQPENVAQFAR